MFQPEVSVKYQKVNSSDLQSITNCLKSAIKYRVCMVTNLQNKSTICSVKRQVTIDRSQVKDKIKLENKNEVQLVSLATGI